MPCTNNGKLQLDKLSADRLRSDIYNKIGAKSLASIIRKINAMNGLAGVDGIVSATWLSALFLGKEVSVRKFNQFCRACGMNAEDYILKPKTEAAIIERQENNKEDFKTIVALLTTLIADVNLLLSEFGVDKSKRPKSYLECANALPIFNKALTDYFKEGEH